jgi:hypothetical protein
MTRDEVDTVEAEKSGKKCPGPMCAQVRRCTFLLLPSPNSSAPRSETQEDMAASKKNLETSLSTPVWIAVYMLISSMMVS